MSKASSLSTWGPRVQGATRADVQVSPVTTLALAWARGAWGRGQARAEAWTRGTELVFEHLGAVDHATVTPADLRTQDEVTVDEGVRAGLIAHALAEQAQRYGRRSEGQGAAAVTLGLLVDAYARDLEDGLADGRDRFGAPVTVGAVRLTPDSLRLDLSMALAAFLDGPRNGSTLRSTDVRDLLRSLREAEGSLFPEGSLAERDQVGPSLSLSWRQAGTQLTEGTPVTGAVELEAVAQDPSGVASLGARILAEPEVALEVEAWSDRTSWPIDTTTLEDGVYEVQVTAADGLDFTRTTTATLRIDHTAPTVMLQAPAQVATPTVALSGTWFDVSGVEQVLLRVEGEVRLVLEHPEPHFDVTLPLGCRGGQSVAVEAVAVDAAGNRSAPAVAEVRCVGTAPTLVLLPSSVVDERVADFLHGPDGELVGVRHPPSPPVVVLDEGAVWPVRLFKLFTRLDADSDNLPVFRWRVAGEGDLTARFRTRVGEVVARDWAPLEVAVGGRIDLPVSYQTFGAGLVMYGPDAVHTAEVEVTDEQGGRVVREVSFQLDVLSPPIWVGACTSVLTPGSLRLGFSAGVDTEVLRGRLRWDLDLEANTEAPSGPARLSWATTTLEGEVVALGEEKWAPTTGFFSEPLSARCAPGANPGGDAFFYTLTAGPGVGACTWGVYPDETLDAFVAGRDGRLSRVSPMPGAFEVLRGRASLVPDGLGRVEIPATEGFDVSVAATQAGLLLPDGGPYTWPTTITVPSGYATTVQAQGRARYPVAAFERTGADHRRLQTEGRAFVTRAFVQRVQVASPPLAATADFPLLGIEVPIFFDATCSTSQVLEIQL